MGGITDAVTVVIDTLVVPVSVGDEVTVSVAVGGITDTVALPVSCTPYDSDADGLRDVPYVSVSVTEKTSDVMGIVTVNVSDAVIAVTVSDTDIVSVGGGITEIVSVGGGM